MSLGHSQTKNIHVDSIIIIITHLQLKYLELIPEGIHICDQLLIQFRLSAELKKYIYIS